MSAAGTAARLVRLYPRAWRARYGRELEGLIAEASGGGRVPWRMRADVALGAVRERARATRLAGDGAPGDRIRGGAVLVLWAWALAILAGSAVQKVFEHWQDAAGAAARGAPATAWTALVAAGIAGCLLVAAGIAAALPAAATVLRAGVPHELRRRLLGAVGLTALMLAATAALVAWAHELPGRERDGHDTAYVIAALAWAATGAAALLAWTAAATATARALRLPGQLLHLHARLAAGVALATAAAAAAAVGWWIALAARAPWVLAGAPRGSTASAMTPVLAAAALAFAAATALAAAGARRALRAVPAL